MGGATFASDGLFTPRMPQSVYERTLQQVKKALLPLFEFVDHAIDTPGKLDHGDIDILAVPIPGHVPSADHIAEAIGAKKYYVEGTSSGIMHFAVLWPEKDTFQDTRGNLQGFALDTVQQVEDPQPSSPLNCESNLERYIQVDLNVCASQQDFTWRLFVHGHGDLINIVSSIIRHKGLIITDHAPYLIIPNLDTASKKLTRLELSRDPTRVLRFLGLEPDMFWKPFASLEAMMSYISTCRFYDPSRVKEETVERRLASQQSSPESKDPKAHYTRPTFRYWYNEYIPTHQGDAPGSSAHMTRNEVREEVYTFFGGDIKQRYENQEREVKLMLGREKLWADLRGQITLDNPTMNDKDVHNSLRAVRREIVPRESLESTDPTLSVIQRAYLSCEWNTVRDWAVANHTAALARWQELVRQSRKPMSIDERKANKFSTSELETYTAEDDAVIVKMKVEEQATWSDILSVLGKTSKSQLQAHWKNDLQGD